MWFNRQKKASALGLSKDSCQSLLAELYSNGSQIIHAGTFAVPK